MEVEQLLSLSGSALAQAVSSLLETPGLYVFSDILELPNVRELENGPHAPVYQLLNLFAYGTYCDYKERAASLPELTPAQRNKLRHLSIISLASNLKCLPYSLLLQQLELKNVRELEDLLIEAVYCDIIQGKLDQRNQQVEVDCSVGRDLGPNELPNIINTLQEWCTGCEAVLCGIEEQVSRANQYRESQLKVKVQVETEVSNLQKTLKASAASPSSGPAPAGAASNQDADQPAEPRDPASSQEPRQPGKKSSKVKGPLWIHQASVGFSSTPAGASEVSYPNNSQGQSQEQREKGVYRVSARSKLEDYLWICSRTGGAGRDRRLVGEIRGAPVVQRQTALEPGNGDNWK
ncbi:COP9 signalosome complex subunit 7b [Nibea albiflora]|uniref:COP9 signalosome complex subunit 7b n=1 Tax=Nibea albiflora TaxID=240163 RepID=A0ACB7FA80_NIBAL|nr:COP9 signalosome complex subunit 7b [Nibea albiflora]